MANKVASANRKIISLEYPTGGLDRSVSYQKQKPYTTPDALNVRACDFTKRNRGGSRPGIGKHEFVQLGSGNPINMLEQVQRVQGDGFTSWQEPFSGSTLGSDWTAITNSTLPPVAQDAINLTQGTSGKAMHDAFAYFDSSKTNSVEMTLGAYDGWICGVYYMFLKSGAEPYTDGIEIKIDAETTQGTLAITVNQYVSSSLTALASTTYTYSEHIVQAKFVALVSGTTLTIYCNGTTIATVTMSGSLTGTQIGLGIENSTLGSLAIISAFGSKYYKTQAVQYSTSLLMAAANGTLYRRAQVDMEAVSSSCTLNASDYLQGVDYLQNLMIADYGPVKVSGTAGALTSGGVLSATGITDWTTYGIDADDDVVEIYNVQGSAVAMTSKITTIATAGLTLTQPAPMTGYVLGAPTYNSDSAQSTIILSSGSASIYMIGLTFKFTTSSNEYTIVSVSDDTTVIVTGDASAETAGGAYSISQSTGAGACAFKVQRGPKVYDSTQNSLSLWTAKVGMGAVPTGCKMACLWRGRLVMSDGTNQWYMSRQLDPYDWYYGADAGDVGRAVSSQNANAGQVGEPVTSLIPCSTNYLIMGCVNSLWLFSGDPTSGGQITNLSRTIGVLSAKSWCRIPSGHILFLSRDGLYAVAPSVGAVPERISREKIPLELLNIDPQTSRVLMAYDKFDVGIDIFVSSPGGVGVHYWFDLDLKSFYPMSLPEAMQPASVLEFASDDLGRSAVLIGGEDGYIRYPADEFESDDGTPFDSYIVIGPFRLGGNDYRHGRLCELIGTLGKDSGPVDWAVSVGDSCEDAVDNAAQATGTWSQDTRNIKEHPFCRGGGASIKISNGDIGRRWGIETITAVVEVAGPQKAL